MDLTEKTLKEVYVFHGRIINVRSDRVLLPNGHESGREVVEHNGGVCVAPLTENEELIFVRQFRYPYKEVLLELPAGKLEKGEDPFEAGKRELLEETGAKAGRYQELGRLYPSPGYCAEIIYLYMAEELSFYEQNPDEDEFLEVEKIPLAQALEMVMRGEIPDSKTQVLILKTAELLRRRRLGDTAETTHNG